MIAPDDHGRSNLTTFHEVVQGATEASALPLPQPADPGGQPLKRHALLRQRDPTPQVLVLREQLEHEAIGAAPVRRVPRQRPPPERSLPLAAPPPDVLRHAPRAADV